MKSLFLSMVVFLTTTTIFGQSNNYFEAMGYPKVVINKNLVAYTVSETEKINGKDTPMRTNNPSTRNPYNIKIISNENQGTIVINNQYQTEDIILRFKYIYRERKGRSTNYYFLMNNEAFFVTYLKDPDSNDSLIISMDKDEHNSITIFYTIANI